MQGHVSGARAQPSGTPSPFDVALARLMQLLYVAPCHVLIRGTVWAVP